MNLDEYDIEKMSGDEVKEAVIHEMRQEQYNKFKMESKRIAENLIASNKCEYGNIWYDQIIQRYEWFVYPNEPSKRKEFYEKLERKYPLLSKDCIYRIIQFSLMEANNHRENEQRWRENRKTKIENAVAISLLVLLFVLLVFLIVINICKGTK